VLGSAVRVSELPGTRVVRAKREGVTRRVRCP